MITKFLSKLKSILFKSEAPSLISEVKKPIKKTKPSIKLSIPFLLELIIHL